MKNKATLTDKIDTTQVLIESTMKGITSNTISKDEIVAKISHVHQLLEFIDHYIAMDELKNKPTLTNKIGTTKILIESIFKGINSNIISKDEIIARLSNILQLLEIIDNYIAMEHDDF